MEVARQIMAYLPELASGPLSLIATCLPKENLPDFLLVSKAWCSSGRDMVTCLKPNREISDTQLERLLEIYPLVETLDLSGCVRLIDPKLGHLSCLKVFIAPR